MAILRHLLNVVGTTLVALMTRIIPRSDSIWVFGGSNGLKYADNPMYLFKYCARRHEDRRRVVWLTRSPSVVEEVKADGHEAYHILTIKGLWLGLRARWHVFSVGPSDTGPTSCGAYHFNLWHGVPLKDIHFQKQNAAPKSYRDRLNRWILRDRLRHRKLFVLSPSHTHVQHMLDAFDVTPEHIVYANLPRNIVFKSEEDPGTWSKSSDKPMLNRLRVLAETGAHIVGYFPTWRGRGMADLFLGATTVSQLDHVNDFLHHRNLYLVTKWHDCVYHAYAHVGESIAAEGLVDYLRNKSNIIVLDFAADLNSHLPYCDLLVTDYSSALFDWLLTQRSFLFAAYDLEEYRERWGFNFDYERFVPGPIVRTIDEFLDALDGWANNLDFGFAERIQELRNTIFESDMGPSGLTKMMSQQHARQKS